MASEDPAPAVEDVPAPPTADLAALKMADAEASSPGAGTPETGAELPAHRSHDPTNNLKRSDPFQFGSRYLEAGDDVFEFNAWDHVETDDAYKEYAEEQMEKQRQSPVSDFDKSKQVPFLLSLPSSL